MQSELSLNVQQSIRPGKLCDTYYPSAENSEKQSAATVEDNRFFVAVGSGNPASGSSATLTFNPNQGLGEVILTLQLAPIVDCSGLQLPLGWGYQLIRRIGYRYGSSQLYYLTGAQNLIQALSLCEDSGKKQQLYNLGGQQLNPADFADSTNLTGYVYLRLPHSSPALSGGALPFPTDVLTAPLQIQIDFADFNTVFTKGGSTPVPTGLNFAQANFTQVTMQNASDLVARRFDMASHALTIPLPEGWTQEALQFPVTTGADGSFQVSLTGCKAGDLRKVRVWFSLPSDVPGAVGVNNNYLWYAPQQITFAINGLIYMDSRQGSWALTNLLRRRTAPSVTVSDIGGPAVPGPVTTFSSQWVEIDLGQPRAIGDTGEPSLVHGVSVMNSVLSLSGKLAEGSTNYLVNVEYVLNCSWLASRGSAEFCF